MFYKHINHEQIEQAHGKVILLTHPSDFVSMFDEIFLKHYSLLLPPCSIKALQQTLVFRGHFSDNYTQAKRQSMYNIHLGSPLLLQPPPP